MSLAAETREAARRHPFLLAALRAGVVNYTAAARFLDVGGDEEAVATALRRFAEDLDPRERPEREARVTMQRGVGVVDDEAEDSLFAVGGSEVAPDAGDLTAVLAEGDVDAATRAAAVERLRAVDVAVRAAAVAGDAMVVAVAGRDGATAVRTVEDVLDGAPQR
jgi:hypothetical protein